MKTKKIALLLSLVVSSTALMPSFANAQTENGWEKVNGTWYYYQSGSLKTGWLQDEGSWYYLNSDGSMKSGWLYYCDNWYYLNDDGSMAAGWKYVGGDWYYLNADGIMQSGWLLDGGAWYYLNPDGSMAHDTVIDGYKIDSNGKYITSSNEKQNKTYTFEEGLNKFAGDSSSVVLSGEAKNKNAMYSPVSLYMALAILSEEAENDTKSQILNALNVNDSDKLSDLCEKLYQKECFSNKDGRLNLANSLWIDDNKDLELNSDTLNNISKYKSTEIFKEDLQSDETAKKVSQWISKNTGGKLGTDPSDFKADENTLMEIFNTIYFKDKWQDTFDKNDTEKDNFKLNDGNTVNTDFMSIYKDTDVYENDEFKSSSLPFKSGDKMMFILPKDAKSSYDILNNKNSLNEALNSLSNSQAKEKNVYFKVPKFNFKSSLDLSESVKKLGMDKMINKDGTANFSKISSNKSLFVGKIKQDSSVTIDEEGGEATAYTEVDLDAGAMPDEKEQTEMVLNKPFIFAIMDKDNTPLFVGVINNPTL